MGEGRGNSAMIAIMLLFCMSVLHSKVVHAFPYTINYTTYTVGDAAGWSYNVENWSNGKQFKAGDNFVFKYDGKKHNVVKVSEHGYNLCVVPLGESVAYLNSGNDKLLLDKGTHYFICDRYDNCQRHGMKIKLNVV